MVEAISPQSLIVLELWERFAAEKITSLKPKTGEKYENLTRLFQKVGVLTIDDSLIVKQSLERVTTLSRTKDALMYLSAACRWGIKHRLVFANPFDGMAAELPKHRDQTDPNPHAFSEEETAQII